MVKTRFAPSPTGYLHIGGARTCLFSWLYARKSKGAFVLRIEDTDRVRSKKEYLDEILESLSWLGIDWDEIFYQSQRFEMYRDFAAQLIKQGNACEREGAIFFSYDFKTIEVNDLIRGKIAFAELAKEEEVIIKSDGSPTYNFSCVIDDASMNITHVIRGEDHISNTPKQILMYQALGFDVPCFVHLPLILSEEGGRMSKRFGATSLREYRAQGFVSEAVVNYLMLLGWSPGEDREIMSLDQAKQLFEIKDINKTASAFSLTKLNWMNSEYIKKMSLEKLLPLAKEFLQGNNMLPDTISDQYLSKILDLFKERIPKLSDLIDRAYFCLYDDFQYGPEAQPVLVTKRSKEIRALQQRLQALADFNRQDIEKEFRATASDVGLKTRDLVHPVRCALTGQKVGPGLFETMEVLGKERVVDRLNRLVRYWEKEE
jgi:glutamyl-tRNA synthetase